MPGKTPRISPLELRKQLLIAESEINRTLMVQELAAVTANLRTLTDRVRGVATFVTSITSLVNGVGAVRSGEPASDGHTNTMPSWVQSLLKGAGVVATVWKAFRSVREEHRDESNKR
jgi:hypothetical protein